MTRHTPGGDETRNRKNIFKQRGRKALCALAFAAALCLAAWAGYASGLTASKVSAEPEVSGGINASSSSVSAINSSAADSESASKDSSGTSTSAGASAGESDKESGKENGGKSSEGSNTSSQKTGQNAGSSGSNASSGSGQTGGSRNPASSSGKSNGNGGGTAKPANPGLATPSSSGKLKVTGSQLTDSKGRAVQLRGISTHGLAWYPAYVNEACFRQLRQEWNVNVIRLAMYTAEYGGYCSGGNKTALKQLIHKGVTYAAAQDMYVIIDWHILSDNNPKQHMNEAKAFFSEMSAKYADYNNVIYEICNEPNGGTSWSDIKSYAETIIGVIRANDKDAVILVGTPTWSQEVDKAAANPITKYDNIMYTLHFYAATHTDSLRNTMAAAVRKGLPVFVSEYGICDASGNGAINESQANKWVSLMDQYGISYVAWNLSNKAETCAILRSNCSKTSGFKESDLSDSGKWLYRMLTGKKAQTQNPPAVSSTSSSSSKPASKPSSSKAPSSSSSKPSSSAAPPQNAEGKVTYKAQLVNQWESNGEFYFHYTLTIQNSTGNPCRQWSVSLPFSGPVSLSDGWNGNYTVNGSTLRITSKDYNGNIPAGGSADNVGFIIKGASDLKLK